MTSGHCTGIDSDSGDAGILSSRYTGQKKGMAERPPR